MNLFDIQYLFKKILKSYFLLKWDRLCTVKGGLFSMNYDPHRHAEPSELLFVDEHELSYPPREEDAFTDAYLSSLGWYDWPGAFY